LLHLSVFGAWVLPRPCALSLRGDVRLVSQIDPTEVNLVMVQRRGLTFLPSCEGGAISQVAAFAFLALTFVCFLAASAGAQVSVLTQAADPARDGVNSNETQLTPTSTIHKLFTLSLNDPVMGQALILGGVHVSGYPTNILFVTTSPVNSTGAASAYAFNADTGAKLWQFNFPTTALGNTGAPVLDPGLGPHGALFAETKDSATDTYKLHALDVLTGSELAGSPVTISASFNGVGFNSAQENDRPGLLDVNGTIYASFAHQYDTGTYHGWLIGYKYTTGSGFSQNGVWCDTCHGGNEGGIWQGGDGPLYDGSHIYVATGNGSIGGGNYSMSVVQLSPSALGTVESSFLQPNASSLSSKDDDLNGGGMAIIPGTGGKIFIGPSKAGSMYLLNGADLGAGAISSFSASGAVGHSPIGWDSGSAQYVYDWPSGSHILQYCYSGGSLGGGPCHESSFSNGGTLAISSAPDGSNAILWAYGGSELHAMNPNNVSAADYWNSSMSSGDSPGGGPGSFQFIAVANGKVYIPTGNSLIAYGTSGNSTCSASPSTPAGLSASGTTSTGTTLSWSAVTPPSGCTISSYTVLEDGSPIASPGSTSFAVTGLSPSTTYSFAVEANDAAGTSAPSSSVSVTTASTGGFSGPYLLVNENTGKVLNSQGKAVDGTPVTQWREEANVNLEWTFIATSNGYYQLNNVKTKLDAAVDRASTASGAEIVLEPFGTDGNDQWKPVLNSDGSYTFYNLHSGLVLDDQADASTSIPMIQSPAGFSSTQKWNLVSEK